MTHADQNWRLCLLPACLSLSTKQIADGWPKLLVRRAKTLSPTGWKLVGRCSSITYFSSAPQSDTLEPSISEHASPLPELENSALLPHSWDRNLHGRPGLEQRPGTLQSEHVTEPIATELLISNFIFQMVSNKPQQSNVMKNLIW